jgi:L-amino acid N-acyltransferase YncA
MSTNVRLATNSDWQQILTIYKSYWDKHFENLPDTYQTVLKYFKESYDNRKGYFNYWVYDNGTGEIYGWFSCLQVFNSPLRRDFNGEISVFIRQDKKYGIIAERLAARAIEDVSNTKLMCLLANIVTKNISSQKLAKHLGFLKSDFTIINTPFYEEVNLWVKELNYSK